MAADDRRTERLKAALRDNLRRRKAAARPGEREDAADRPREASDGAGEPSKDRPG